MSGRRQLSQTLKIGDTIYDVILPTPLLPKSAAAFLNHKNHMRDISKNPIIKVMSVLDYQLVSGNLCASLIRPLSMQPKSSDDTTRRKIRHHFSRLPA